MLSRHHNDGKVKSVVPEEHVICPWTMSPFLGSPILLECCICNGPFITYGNEEAWQPRQRTQAMDLYYHGDPEPDFCCSSDTCGHLACCFAFDGVPLALAPLSREAEHCLRRERRTWSSAPENIRCRLRFTPVECGALTKLSCFTSKLTPVLGVRRCALFPDPMKDKASPLASFMKQRKMGLNDFIQKLSTNSYACKHPEVQSILNLAPPQDVELMNSNPSPPLKPNISNAARHLLEGLLQKDRIKRLGFTDDFAEIKSHMFFSPINWDDLNAKKLTPPFNPNVTGPNDLRHFDPEFTDEPVPNSIGCSPDSALVTASISEAEAFLGFSYAPAMDSYL
ncbi:hypothetical protein DNTS_009110 [Danionella cerebrum]|uniref:AGC-kinase C-terminal domain-containing protein n=1 Tax=Danionella cerebrum TaxID=2873325 RepID=A0A553QAP2_9TELE|nr:hypothetical protein DNTS_009110 [Danionella translucida]